MSSFDSVRCLGVGPLLRQTGKLSLSEKGTSMRQKHNGRDFREVAGNVYSLGILWVKDRYVLKGKEWRLNKMKD